MSNDSGAIPVAAGLAIGVAFVISFSFLFSVRAAGPQSYDDVQITLDRSACFGFCPDYSLTIYGNGTVIYEGRNFVTVTGKQTSTIPQEDVRELVRSFYEINYFSLKDEYTAGVTDLPTTITSISIDGRFKKVIDYYGAPEALRELEDKIDDTANSDIWVRVPAGNGP